MDDPFPDPATDPVAPGSAWIDEFLTPSADPDGVAGDPIAVAVDLRGDVDELACL